MSWGEAMTVPLGRAEDQVREIVDLHVARLAGQPVRSSRFLREIERCWPASGEWRLAGTTGASGERV